MAAMFAHRPARLRPNLPDTTLGPSSGINQRRAIKLSDTFTTIRREILAWLALIWMFGAVAFSLLIAAGATGLLG